MFKEGGIHIPVLNMKSIRDYSFGCGIKLFLSFKVGI